MNTTVVLALYNGERYIIEQLESLKNQTKKIDEVLIIDDQSSDRSYDIVKSYIKENQLESTWNLTKNTLNKGYIKNFLDNAQNCKGDIVFFCDQDDIWDVRKIEKMYTVMENKSILLLSSDLKPFASEQHHKRLSRKYVSSMINDGTLEKIYPSSYNIHLRRSGCSMCIRKDYLISIKEYWVKGWAHDDFVWKFSVIDNGCYIYHENLISRRLHNQNTSNIKLRTLKSRIDQIRLQIVAIESLLSYTRKLDYNVLNLLLLEKFRNSLYMRERFLATKNLLIWLKIFFCNRDSYVSIMGAYLDLYLKLFKKHRKR